MTISAHVLAAALTAVSVNGSRISEASMTAALEAALAVLNTPQPVSPVDLQPGERIWVLEGYDNDSDSVKVCEQTTFEEVAEYIADAVEESKGSGNSWYRSPHNYELTADDFHVLVVRREIRPKVEANVKVSFA